MLSGGGNYKWPLLIFSTIYLLQVFVPGKTQSQNLANSKPHIDTVKFVYKIEGIVNVESLAPQLISSRKSSAIEKINKDILTRFNATSINMDSTQYEINCSQIMTSIPLKNCSSIF